MGTDTPIAVLSKQPKLLYDYFKQNFAQVTNPPIDPIREELVMSLVSMIGPRPNLLGHRSGHAQAAGSRPADADQRGSCRRSARSKSCVDGAFRTATIDMHLGCRRQAPTGCERRCKRMCWAATEAVLADYNILILSDRASRRTAFRFPPLLATAAVHHHLIRQGLRMQTGLVVETGEAREVHHFCVLAGYGAEAINPYLAFETLEAHPRAGRNCRSTADEVQKNYIKAVGKGMLKVMSKMGISTYQSYCGAQIFDAVGLTTAFIEQYFTGTATTIEGIGLEEIAEEAVRRHAQRYGDNPIYRDMLDVGGDYAFRLRGEEHAWTPDNDRRAAACGARQQSPELQAEFAAPINEQSERLLTLRGLMEFKLAEEPIPLDEVEPASEIVKRFATGAMCFGSISPRSAHQSGDRDEPHRRQVQHRRRRRRARTLQAAGQRRIPMRSAIKQVASGRFGVTTEYLVNADDIQIKIAQGAKPGEGGQLPGHKVGQDHRASAPFDAGRGPDLAAAASRHLFDRGSGAADPRSEERQSHGAHFGQTGVRSRRRHGRGGRAKGARRSCDDFRL